MKRNVRAHVSMVFHLDKCLGCHTCSVACKNIWTDRRGAEYMWWNNVETKPGTGYPILWEDQEKYQGGWQREGAKLGLKMHSRLGALANIFHSPFLPTIDEYYEPWTYKYDNLINAPAGDEQPTARPISQLTGKPMNIEFGPNWDDDLSGSQVYAANDPNLKKISVEERELLLKFERLVFFYLPRICNHCLNASCLAACPSGAIYKRGEDGIVLVNQEMCRAWRKCVTGCPYKKTYYNWSTGKADKCILCYPRLEVGKAPACFNNCVGRLRYIGVLLYDANRLEESAKKPPEHLVEAQRELFLDPFDPEVVAEARENGIHDGVISAAQGSPVYKFVIKHKIALPLHAEFGTVPMLFYVPSLLPVAGTFDGQTYKVAEDFFTSLENVRIPIRYQASLFTGGNEAEIIRVFKKLYAVRAYRREKQMGDVSTQELQRVLEEAQTTAEEIQEIYHLTALANFEERFVIPPMMREQAIEATEDVYAHKGHIGFGFLRKPAREW